MTESPTEHLEQAEHAQHAAHSGDPTLARITVTIAVLAVLAATAGSFETVESGLAITDKNESVLLQNKATDAWAFFQAQSIKKNLYDLASANIADADRKAAYDAKGREYEKEAAEARKTAEDLEAERDHKLADSTGHEHRHHVLTAGVTMLHVAIAVCSIAIIARGRRWPWYGAMVLGVIGTVMAGAAFF